MEGRSIWTEKLRFERPINSRPNADPRSRVTPRFVAYAPCYANPNATADAPSSLEVKHPEGYTLRRELMPLPTILISEPML